MCMMHELNSQIKSHREPGWIKKMKPKYMLSIETHFSFEDTTRLKIKDGRWYSKQTETKRVILISDKIYFKPKRVTRNKEGHYVMIKGWVPQKVITIVNIYAPSTRASKYIKQIITDLQGELKNNNTTIVR